MNVIEKGSYYVALEILRVTLLLHWETFDLPRTVHTGRWLLHPGKDALLPQYSHLSAKMNVYTAPGVLSCLQAINNKLAEPRYRRVYDRKANGCDTARVGKCCLEVSVDIPDIPTTCRVGGDLLHLSLLQYTVCKRRYSIIRDSATSTDEMPTIRKKPNEVTELTRISKNLL